MSPAPNEDRCIRVFDREFQRLTGSDVVTAYCQIGDRSALADHVRRIRETELTEPSGVCVGLSRSIGKNKRVVRRESGRRAVVCKSAEERVRAPDQELPRITDF